MPHVTVIIPNYNYGRFLENRIESILKQSYKDFEIICLDDASTDNSQEILTQYSRKFDFKVVANQQNSGSPFPQWNRGIRLAKGDYIWIAEADDLAEPDLLEKLVAVLDKYENVGMVYCQSLYLNSDNVITGNHVEELLKLDNSLWKNDFIQNGKKLLESHMATVNIIPNASALLFRKHIFDQVGGADETMQLCGDWLTWTKMLLISDLAYIAKPLNYFRMHDSSVRSHVRCTHRYIQEYLQVVKFIAGRVPIGELCRRRIIYQLKARWSRLAIENPQEVNFQSVLNVSCEINRLMSYTQAFQFCIIGLFGFFSIGSIFRRESETFKLVLKTLRQMALKRTDINDPCATINPNDSRKERRTAAVC